MQHVAFAEDFGDCSQNVKCYLGRGSDLQVLWLCFHTLVNAKPL